MNLKPYPRRKRQIKINYILPRNIDWSLLNKNQTKVIKMRWGIDEYKIKYNMREIAEMMNTTLALVTKYEREALKILRAKS
jgi:DNA-directed RNA polymerase sigma subunit (sigma70/sigma32)